MVFKYSTKLKPIKYCIAFRLYVPLQPFFIRSKRSYIVGQEVKNENSKHLFYSKVVGFGPETCCFTEIKINHTRFPVSFQNSLSLEYQ